MWTPRRSWDSAHPPSAESPLGRAVAAAGRFIDLGDVIVDNEQGSMVDGERTEAAIGAVLATGSRIVSIGGDHSVTYPIVRSR